jgi:NAD(P)-dependent dehydrogenase (short-subunit alcohol dehydrogenase family)
MGDRTSELPSFRLEGRLAVMTGASEGIGRGLALALGQSGARLALVSRAPDRLREVVDTLGTIGAEARTYQADVRVRADLDRLAEAVTASQGAAEILINAAGVPLTTPAADVTEAEWDAVIDTGLKGVFFACLAFGRGMRQRRYGKIINLGSTYSESVAPGKSVYAIAKAGVAHLTRALALEWAADGVRVNALAPTLTATPTRQALLADEERMRYILARIPMGRYARPSDLTGAALFLASDASDFVTGQTLYVDGGWNAAR